MNRENRLIFRDIDRPSDEDLADEFDRQDRQEYASLDNFNEENQFNQANDVEKGRIEAERQEQINLKREKMRKQEKNSKEKEEKRVNFMERLLGALKKGAEKSKSEEVENKTILRQLDSTDDLLASDAEDIETALEKENPGKIMEIGLDYQKKGKWNLAVKAFNEVINNKNATKQQKELAVREKDYTAIVYFSNLFSGIEPEEVERRVDVESAVGEALEDRALLTGCMGFNQDCLEQMKDDTDFKKMHAEKTGKKIPNSAGSNKTTTDWSEVWPELKEDQKKDLSPAGKIKERAATRDSEENIGPHGEVSRIGEVYVVGNGEKGSKGRIKTTGAELYKFLIDQSGVYAKAETLDVLDEVTGDKFAIEWNENKNRYEYADGDKFYLKHNHLYVFNPQPPIELIRGLET